MFVASKIRHLGSRSLFFRARDCLAVILNNLLFYLRKKMASTIELRAV